VWLMCVWLQTMKDMDAIQSIFTTGAYKQVREWAPEGGPLTTVTHNLALQRDGSH
jgi:hypothetical protein